jgi:hypothetical protein
MLANLRSSFKSKAGVDGHAVIVADQLRAFLNGYPEVRAKRSVALLRLTTRHVQPSNAIWATLCQCTAYIPPLFNTWLLNSFKRPSLIFLNKTG